jgi:signal recognition particle receptor subunit beta
MNFEELKLVFGGAVGAGKSTAIHQISEINPVVTDAVASDADTRARKARTTVAMDYGEVRFGDDQILRLYGMPGQRRFKYMWSVLGADALGFVILIDNSRRWPVSDLSTMLDLVTEVHPVAPLVIGITHCDISSQPEMDQYYEFLSERNRFHPLLAVDVRMKDDVLLLLDTLLACIQNPESGSEHANHARESSA